MAVQKRSTYTYRAACSTCKWRGREGSKENAMKEQREHDKRHARKKLTPAQLEAERLADAERTERLRGATFQ